MPERVEEETEGKRLERREADAEVCLRLPKVIREVCSGEREK